MEPMALGSPSGSPATNPYLPSFLLGEQQQTPSTPRNNTLSPNKAGRNLSFGFGATSPNSGMQPSSPQDYNRSVLGQKTLFGGYQQTPPAMSQSMSNYAGTPMQNHNASISGPPTQGLFDSLRSERNQVQTPTRLQSQAQFAASPCAANASAVMNQSIQQQQQQMANVTGQFNDSYISNLNATNTSFNMSRTQGVGIVSPLNMTGAGAANANSSLLLQCPPQPRYTEFWITVFGFPPGAASTILQHFAQCGTIVDKIFPSQNGNWVHIKYSSRLECDKALNYNEKILANNIMIGVTQCKDRTIIDKENLCENNNG